MLFGNDILFLHVPKTAGTSIENAIHPSKDFFLPRKTHCLLNLNKHSDYNMYAQHPEFKKDKKYFTFLSLRNPLDRHYSYFKRHINGKRVKYSSGTSMVDRFNDYMVNRYKEDCKNVNIPLRVESNIFLKYCSGNYNVLDFVVLFENIEEDWCLFKEKIPSGLNLGKIPKLNSKKHSNEDTKNNVYSQESLDIFISLNKKDIEFYNYNVIKKNNLSNKQKNSLLIRF